MATCPAYATIAGRVGETDDGEKPRVAHPGQPAFSRLFSSLRENLRELYGYRAPGIIVVKLLVLVDVVARVGTQVYNLTILYLLDTYLINTLDISRTIGQW